MSSGHALWVRDLSLPDIGATDACPPELLPPAAVLAPHAPPGASTPSVSTPGAHRCVCVELGVYHLALCALLKSDSILALEGHPPGAEVCWAALTEMRKLVQEWQER